MERNRYFYGKLLTVRDFEAEQNYAGAKRRLINRLVHGAGVVCGLGVTASDDTTLIIESGMALDYLGREILIEEPLIRKLEMIEGQELLKGRSDVYLCLAYDETDIEPVNAVGADHDNQQFNMTKEGYRLFFAAQPPEYRGLLEAQGKENVNIIYSSDMLTLIMYAPVAVCAGEEFSVNVLIIKNDKTLPVRFTLEGENYFVESDNENIHLEYFEQKENTQKSANVLETSFRLKAQNLSNVAAQLFPNGVELNVELGSHKYKNFITVNADMFICADHYQLQDHLRKTDTLAKHMRGPELPVYLAKLELVAATDRVFLGTVTKLPFGQELAGKHKAARSDMNLLTVTTAVRSLEFWQKPDVKASFSSSSNSMHLDFGLPTPELYDYVTSHGVVDIATPGGIKVNARYYSEEIPHGLGPGNVDVRLSIEFEHESSGIGHLFGNSEVFRAKQFKIPPPWVEAAAIVYPERGTMRIGVWLHDNVEGNLLHVHYYAQKPERDTRRLLEKRQISLSVLPEVSRLGKREHTRFKAVVQGSEDRNVIWQVKDENGGSIDGNGNYQAPEEPGTYEIVVRASADETIAVSAFVIVE